jgi:hypothetical protein
VSVRCQIEFRNGAHRCAVYRAEYGVPNAVLPDLLSFLAWNAGGGDLGEVMANFVYWSKRRTEQEQWKPRGRSRYAAPRNVAADEERASWDACGSTTMSVLHHGLAICTTAKLRDDIAYYYLVCYDAGGCTISAYEVEHDSSEVRVGRLVAVAPAPFFFSSARFTSG